MHVCPTNNWKDRPAIVYTRTAVYRARECFPPSLRPHFGHRFVRDIWHYPWLMRPGYAYERRPTIWHPDTLRKVYIIGADWNARGGAPVFLLENGTGLYYAELYFVGDYNELDGVV